MQLRSTKLNGLKLNINANALKLNNFNAIALNYFNAYANANYFNANYFKAYSALKLPTSSFQSLNNCFNISFFKLLKFDPDFTSDFEDDSGNPTLQDLV